MIKRLKTLHPEREYPANLGKRWTDDEYNQLLTELEQKLDYETIAKIHSRTVGGIKSQLERGVWVRYLNSISIDDICEETSLSRDSVLEIISRKQKKMDKVTDTLK
jgi:hypothetical protein